MPLSKKPFSRRNQHSNWRDYQSALPKKNSAAKDPTRRIAQRIIIAALLVLIGSLGFYFFPRSANVPVRVITSPTFTATTKKTVDNQLDKGQVRQLLNERAFSHLTGKKFSISDAGNILHVETTLDPELQNYLIDTIDRVNSRYVGIVVMEGTSGQVLALAGFDRTDSFSNPCLRSQFPAASIFKIVTAATAIDQCGYSTDSPMNYNGPKHTLYKRQLTDKVDRNTTTIPLREAFAESVNPVFGKLGVLRLRKPLLEEAAATFGFNQSLNFDLSLPPSQFVISDKPYNWAEIASGFNLETTLSPLHGAALVTAILNKGRMVTPAIVEKVTDDQDNTLYRRTEEKESRQIMSARAATALTQMMESTIIDGTARKTFRKYQTDKVLSHLQIGGKTGSIDSASHDVRFDWFIGFARDRQSQKQIVVAVMVGHEKFIGIRASDYARRAMTYYFGNPSGKGS